MQPAPAEAPRATAGAPPVRRFVFGLLLAAWFCYFSRDVFAVHFAPDDMMNADNFYWSPGLWRLFYSQFLIWRGYYRPMGGLFYVPIVSRWGLDPVPFHLVLSLILLFNVYLLYRLVRLLGADDWVACLAALVAAYHAGLANLYYNTAFIYDALCGAFFFAALDYYFKLRNGGKLLNLRQKLIFAGLLICALNSKEMALTVPFVLVAYEWVYHRPAMSLRRARVWLRGPGSVIVLASILIIADVYGKVFGFDALTGMAGYRPVFTWRRFLDYQKTFLRRRGVLQRRRGRRVGFLGVITYLAWRPGARPILRFCWLFLVFTPLPIEFLPDKSQACLYIPMPGWRYSPPLFSRTLPGALAGQLSREPIFRQLATAGSHRRVGRPPEFFTGAAQICSENKCL